MAGVAILIPVLRRPHRVAPLLANIKATTPEEHRVIFIADKNDWYERLALQRAGAEVAYTDEPPPNYPAKMNLAFSITDEPFVFLAADDLRFHYGWLSAAFAQMQDNIAVVGTNDGGVNKRVLRGEHATHMLVRRAYVDEYGATFDETPGGFVHGGYGHVYVDDELVQVARMRKVYAHAHDSLVEHLHPYGGNVDTDEVYEIGQQSIGADKLLYKQRRNLFRRAGWTSPSWSQPSETTPG